MGSLFLDACIDQKKADEREPHITECLNSAGNFLEYTVGTPPSFDKLWYKSYSMGRWTWPTPLKSPEPSPTRQSRVGLELGRSVLELKLHEEESKYTEVYLL